MADFELLAPGGHQKLVDEVVDRLDLKADIDGYYAQLTAGAADNLTGRGDTTTAEFLYRTAGGTADIETGQAVAKSVKGNTLVWNQLADNGNFANGSTHWAARESTLTVADGVATVVPDSAGAIKGLIASSTMGTCVLGHKYLISTEFSTNEATNLSLSFAGANQIIVTVPSVNTWHTCRAIWTNSNSETRILPYFLAPASLTTSAQLKYRNVQIFDLTQMFGAGNEPSTVAEFEALFPEPYYAYDAGSLLSVNMTGIETTGFNQWDGTWEIGGINSSTGQSEPYSSRSRTFYIPVFPNTEYYQTSSIAVFYYDADKNYLSSRLGFQGPATFTTPANCHYIRFMYNAAAMPSDTICINLSWSGRRDGEYEPYWSSQRTIAASTYFPDGMRSAGTVRDELTSTEAITRVGAVDLGTLTWTKISTTAPHWRFYAHATSIGMAAGTNMTCQKYDTITTTQQWQGVQGIASQTSDGSVLVMISDEAYTDIAAFKTAMSGVMLHYELATPTVTPIDPALNLSYRVDDFGTERVMVPEDELSAPPVLDIAYGLNVVDFVRRAPTQYISAASFAQYLLARDAHDGTTTTMTWDDTDNRYEFAITDTATEG